MKKIFETTEEFWDCECEYPPNNYIWPKDVEKCERCGAHRDDQPNSRVVEVEKLKNKSILDTIREQIQWRNKMINAACHVPNISKAKDDELAEEAVNKEDVRITFTITLPQKTEEEAIRENNTFPRTRLINDAAHRFAEFTQTKYNSDIGGIEIGLNYSEIKEYTLENGVNVRWDIEE